MIQGTLTERDLRDAAWTNLRPRRSLGIIGCILVALFLWALWYSFFGARSFQPDWSRWAMLGVAVYFVGGATVWIPYKVRKTYRQRKDLQRPCTYLPMDSGLRFDTEGVHGTKPWSDYLKWKEGRSVFLLYMSDQLFQVVPKHFFTSSQELEIFRGLVSEKVERHEV